MTDDELLAEARAAGHETERLRQAMMSAAEQRRRPVRELHARGWSVRAIARELDVSAGVVQELLSPRRLRR